MSSEYKTVFNFANKEKVFTDLTLIPFRSFKIGRFIPFSQVSDYNLRLWLNLNTQPFKVHQRKAVQEIHLGNQFHVCLFQWTDFNGADNLQIANKININETWSLKRTLPESIHFRWIIVWFTSSIFHIFYRNCWISMDP